MQHHEEAQVFVHDLNLSVTVQLLEETPAVLSPGKLCNDHGYSYQWVSGQEPRLTKDGKSMTCETFSYLLSFQGYLLLDRNDKLATRRLGQESLRDDKKDADDPLAHLPF